MEVRILGCAVKRTFCFVFIPLILIAGIATPVWAHAVLMDSKPKLSSTVSGPDLPIWLRFNVRVDGSRSRLHLVAADGSSLNLDPLKQPTPDTLESHATGVKPGAYKLQWQVLAADGHISRGVVDFTVK
jgi:copper resistance protein C